MKKLSILFALLFGGVASAAPYIVYSGSIQGTNFSSGGPNNANTRVYLLTDVSNTANFAVLLVDPAKKTYSVIGRPSDSPASDEGLNNFLGSVGTGRAAHAALAYSIETTDSSNATTLVRAYATGPLTAAHLVLAPARKSLVVTIKTERVANGTYTFNASPAVTSAGLPYAETLNGTSFGYVIDSTGALVHATTPGDLSLRISPGLSTLANVGGGYEVALETEIAVMPVTIADGQSESDAFVAWLSAFAQANGYSVPPANAPDSQSSALAISTYAGGTDVDGGTLSLGGSISGGSALTVSGGGTLKLGSGGSIITNVNPGSLNNFNGSGLLVFGGLGTGTATLTANNSLTFNLGGTSTLTLDSGTITLGGGLTFSGGTGFNGGGGIYTLLSLNIAPGATLTAGSGTLTLTGISGGTASGTITLPGIGGMTAALPLSGTTLIVNGSGDLSGLTAGTVLTGSITLSGGAEANQVYSSGTLTITTP